ncbi:MAG: hypothetical protein WDO56_01490 [Gammaproteobacteria bacterium]
MHTVLVLAGGALLLGVFLLAGRIFGGASSSVLASWALYFIPVWLIASAVNMWVGVKKAGYSFWEELPIFFLVFALPAIVAAAVWWWLSRGS